MAVSQCSLLVERLRPSSLRTKIVSGSLWSIGAEILAGGARAASYFLYARLLSPTDFGLIAFCLLLVSLFPLLIDNSLGLALIRYGKDDQRTHSVTFFLNVGLSGLAIAGLCLGAGQAAHLLHDQRVAIILPILSLQLLFNSLCATHMSIGRRRFEFRRLLPVRLISTFCSVGFGVPLAFLGYGYWALVVGSVLAAAGQMVAAWALLPWRPSFVFDWKTAKSLTVFGSWVAVDMGVTWLLMSGGGFMLALFLGAHDLGLFRLSDQIDAYLLGAILSPLIPVFYTAFCETSADRQEWQRLLARMSRLVAIAAMGLAGLIATVALPIEAVIGPRWHGIGAILVLNAIADGVAYAILPIPSLMRAQGCAKALAGMRIAMVIAQMAVYAFVAPHGLRAFVIAKIALELMAYVISYVALSVLFALPVRRLAGSQIGPTLVAAASGALGLWVSSIVSSMGPIAASATGLLVFCVPLGTYLWLVERHLVRRLFNMLNLAPQCRA